MRLQVHRSGDAFLEALAADRGCHYVTFGRSATLSSTLRRTEQIAAERGHQPLAAARSVRTCAEALLRAFFDEAARCDPHRRYAHSSRVLLAVPDYPDIALLFLLRAMRTLEPASTVHALVADARLAALVRHDDEGGEAPVFRRGGWRGPARAGRTLLRAIAAPRTRRRCEVLVFTLGDTLANGGADTYFGELAAALAARTAVHTVYAAPGARLRLPASEAISPLEAYLRPSDVAGALAAARRHDDHTLAGPQPVMDYLRAREHAAGETVMLRIMTQAFGRMLATLKPRAVLYPFENRSWEKHLLTAARARGGIRCIGYQHSSITPRHLAFSNGAGHAGPADLPDTIITCGEVTAEMIAAGMPQTRPLVRAGAALRARRLSVPPPSRGVLAPISSSRAEAWEMLRVLHEAVGLTDQSVIVRAHPAIPVDDLYAQFEWPRRVRLSRGRTLAEDFAETGTVVYSSSTVALEGLLYGRLPIYLEVGDIPSGDPLHGEHAFVFRAGNARDFADTLEAIDALGSDALAALRSQGRAYAERYLVEPSATNVERMADEIARC